MYVKNYPSYLLSAYVNAIHEYTGIAVLQHARLVQNDHQVSPLAFLCELRASQAHRRVIDDRILL